MHWTLNRVERPFFFTNNKRDIGLSIMLDYMNAKLRMRFADDKRRPNKKNVSQYYKRYILQFKANHNRHETVFPCYNSYHRRLVHLFCEAHGLEHKKEKGRFKYRDCDPDDPSNYFFNIRIKKKITV